MKVVVVALVLASAGAARAQYQTVISPDEDEADEAESDVTRADMERRLPRSAPDAVKWEPGVFVQQTAHGQGSVFLRGLTGQQTLILFDGIRLNNSTYRQGPNQYFFTLDARSVQSIRVIRGGASTRWGSDAIGGVIAATPISAEPAGGTFIDPTFVARGASADVEVGGRVEAVGGWGRDTGFFAGFGARTVGLLESGGRIADVMVPRFDDDGRTQLGTGFDELTADARVTHRSGTWALTGAAYAYRQYDAARTDQCAPPFARHDECLRYAEQFRHLAYLALDAGPRTRVTLSFQHQHERRRGDRPASFVVNVGEDDVYTQGVQLRASSAWLGRWRFHGGFDNYIDTIASEASTTFTDIDVTRERSRGQYLDGSSYVYGGGWGEVDFRAAQAVRLTAGARLSWIAAGAPADEESGTEAIDRAWFPLVGNLRATFRPARGWALHANADRSFRAPNLDDMTSRQQTGPGFQFENPDLEPETALTGEVGVARRRGAVDAEVWLFTTYLDGAIGKAPREADECPPDTPQCESSWSRFQLVNAREPARIHGVEASLLARLPARIRLRATAAWTWGEGPNLADPPTDPSLPYQERVPLSRIPPLNGTAEVWWSPRSGVTTGAALRWATRQDRLAVADLSDARIPVGGTPGFAVVDLRASWRLPRRFVAGIVIENLFDAAYRTHGSSVNNPGLGVVATLAVTPW